MWLSVVCVSQSKTRHTQVRYKTRPRKNEKVSPMIPTGPVLSGRVTHVPHPRERVENWSTLSEF